MSAGLLGLILGLAWPASAQPAAPVESPARAVVTAAAVSAPPIVDGVLTDEIWKGATRITTFVQQLPLDGAPASEDTEVLLAFDRDHLYLGIRAHYADPSMIRANLSDRDQIWQDDTVRVYIDPFLDQQRAYVFAVNAYGIQGDSLLAPTGGGGGGGRGGRGGGGGGGGGGGRGPSTSNPSTAPGDPSWNALFASAGRLVDGGWTAEMAIPFKSLRYPARGPAQPHRWGFQIQRTILGKNEAVVWSPVSRAVQGFLRQLGELQGLRDLSTSRNLELQPTVTAVHTSARDEGDAFATARSAEAGVNLKYGLTSNLTLDFTVNPDFSQVESDRPQIQTNQRFPLFIQEQRPFFVEGQENFSLQAPVTVLHTRTVVAPRVGAKITGKVGRTLVGLLVADDQAAGQLDDPSTPGYGGAAQVLVGRVRQVLYGDSSIGAIATSRSFAGSYSRLAGVDGTFRFGTSYRVRAVALTARHRDLEQVDNSGSTWRLQFDRSGRSLSYEIGHGIVDPGFRTDLGFVRRTDTRTTEARLDYTFWPEGQVTSWGPQFRVERIHDEAGVLQNNTVSAGVSAQFAANMTADVTVNRDLERFDEADFRPNRVVVGGSIDRSRVVSFRGQFSFGRAIRYVDAPFLGRGTETNLTVNLRPLSRARSEITLTTSRLVDPRTGSEEFDVRILRALSTYQISSRLLLRNITEYNTSARTVGMNLLATYRVDAGTAFFFGYDDRFSGLQTFDDGTSVTLPWRRSNRGVFAKLQVLLRY